MKHFHAPKGSLTQEEGNLLCLDLFLFNLFKIELNVWQGVAALGFKIEIGSSTMIWEF